MAFGYKFCGASWVSTSIKLESMIPYSYSPPKSVIRCAVCWLGPGTATTHSSTTCRITDMQFTRWDQSPVMPAPSFLHQLVTLPGTGSYNTSQGFQMILRLSSSSSLLASTTWCLCLARSSVWGLSLLWQCEDMSSPIWISLANDVANIYI